MLRPDLVNRVTEAVFRDKELPVTPDEKALVKVVTYAVFDEIVNACMHGDYVAISGFGKFFPRMSKAKLINNGLKKAMKYSIPPRLKLKFKSSETADRILNDGLQGYMRAAQRQVAEEKVEA